MEKTLKLLISTLITYASIEENASTYFSAATLQIESIVYLLKRIPINLKKIEENMQKAYANYIRFAQTPPDDVIQPSQLYAVCLAAIINLYLHPPHKEKEYIVELDDISTPLGLQYQKLLSRISQALEKQQYQPFIMEDQEMVDLYQNSIEIKKIYDVIIALKKMA